MHLDLLEPVPRAGFAAAAFDVEGKTARSVAAHLCFRKLRVPGADEIERAGVSGGIRARGAADRALIDVHHLVDVLDTGDGSMRAGLRTLEPQSPRDRGEQD